MLDCFQALLDQVDRKDAISILALTLASASFLLSLVSFRFARRSSEVQFIQSHLSSICAQIDSIQFRVDGELRTGVDAIYAFSLLDPLNHNSVVNHVSAALSKFEALVEYVDRSRVIPRSSKEHLKTTIYIDAYAKILWPAHSSIYSKWGDKLFGAHDDSKLILPRFERFFNATLKHLSNVHAIDAPCPFPTTRSKPHCAEKKHYLSEFSTFSDGLTGASGEKTGTP